MDEQSKSRFEFDLYFTIFIAMIASIKFDVGFFKIHLAEMGIFNFPFIWHFNTILLPF
jgi:hypothetical protein